MTIGLLCICMFENRYTGWNAWLNHCQEMHVLFRNGIRAAACGREDKSVDLTMVGEVCIVLEDFLKAHTVAGELLHWLKKDASGSLRCGTCPI